MSINAVVEVLDQLTKAATASTTSGQNFHNQIARHLYELHFPEVTSDDLQPKLEDKLTGYLALDRRQRDDLALLFKFRGQINPGGQGEVENAWDELAKYVLPILATMDAQGLK